MGVLGHTPGLGGRHTTLVQTPCEEAGSPWPRAPGWQGSQGTVGTLRSSWAKRCWGPAQASVGQLHRACPRVGTSLLMPGPTCRGQPGHWARDARLPSPLARASRHDGETWFVLASAAPSSQTVLQPMQEVLGPGDPVRWNVSTQGLHPPPGRDALIHASDVTCTLRP